MTTLLRSLPVLLALAIPLSLAAAPQDAGGRQRQAQPAREGQPRPGPAPITVEARPEAGFHQPYLLIVPERVRPGAPIIVALPTPPTSEDPAVIFEASSRMAQNAGPFMAQLGSPVLVPVIPRPPVRTPEGTINLYLPALTREALLADDPKLARIDRQVLAMVDDARRRIGEENGSEIQEKAIFVGFSAGGHFATRMAVLHPKRVLAVWAGGTGGHPILPLGEFGDQRLSYPVGVADLEEVAGAPFDAEAFAKIPIMLVQGSADTNTSLPGGEGPSDSYQQEQAEVVRKVLGPTALERLEQVKKAYAEAESKLTVKVYEGVEHRMSPEIVGDLVAFIESVAANERVAD